MGISNLCDDHAERNLGIAEVLLSTAIPRGWKRASTTEPHIGLFSLHNTNEKLAFTLPKVVLAIE